MNNKILVGIVAVIIVVVAVVAIGLSYNTGNDERGTAVTAGVNYHGNGAETDKGETVFGLTSSTIGFNVFTAPEGKTFAGWNTHADGTGETYMPGQSIDYGKSTVDLYAQWAYLFSVSTTYLGFVSPSDFSIILADSPNKATVVSGGAPLPSDGSAAIAIQYPAGTTWTVDAETGTFYGKNGNIEYKVSIELEGADLVKYDYLDNMPVCLFTYDGPVTADVLFKMTTHA